MDKISSEISANSVSDDGEAFGQFSCFNDEEFFAQFSCSDDEDIEDEDNGELFLDRYFTSSQRRLIDSFEFSEYKRSKRSNKKRNARNQIKDKNGRSVRKNFNRPLYIHHRLWKVLYLDQPCRHNFGKLETVPLYSVDELRSIVRLKREFYRQIEMAFQDRVKPVQPPPAIHHFALNSAYLHNEPTFDDAMIAFLLDLQNRDLSPEDYENLLRLDERVQKKTVQTSVFDSLISTEVNESQTIEFCSICMENYSLGQICKILPCQHIFHSECIRNYLLNFSNQCPLDNLPLN